MSMLVLLITFVSVVLSQTRYPNGPVYGSNILGDYQYEFDMDDIYCTDGIDCIVDCLATSSCRYSTIHGPMNASLTVNCGGGDGTDVSMGGCWVDLTVHAENSTILTINVANNYDLSMSADLHSAYIYTPTTDTINTYITCGNDSDSNKLYDLPPYFCSNNYIYSPFGFNTISFRYFGNRSFPNNMNNIMYCNSNYSHTCTDWNLDPITRQFICPDSDNLCTNPYVTLSPTTTQPSPNPTSYPSTESPSIPWYSTSTTRTPTLYPSSKTGAPSSSPYYPSSPTSPKTTVPLSGSSSRYGSIWMATTDYQFDGDTFHCQEGSDCYIYCTNYGACQYSTIYAPASMNLTLKCGNSSGGTNYACYGITIYAEQAFSVNISSHGENDLSYSTIYAPQESDIDTVLKINCLNARGSCYGMNQIYNENGFKNLLIFVDLDISDQFIMHCGNDRQFICDTFYEPSLCSARILGYCAINCTDRTVCSGYSATGEPYSGTGGPYPNSSPTSRPTGIYPTETVYIGLDNIPSSSSSSNIIWIVIAVVLVLGIFVIIIIAKKTEYCCYEDEDQKAQNTTQIIQIPVDNNSNALSTPGLNQPIIFKAEIASAPPVVVEDDYKEEKEEKEEMKEQLSTTNGAGVEYKNVAPSAPDDNDMVEMIQPGEDQDKGVVEANTNDNNNGENEGLDMREKEKQRIKQWFHDEVQLFDDNETYYKAFIDNGFEKMSMIKKMDDDTLKAIGIEKLGHRKEILYAIEKL